jgi:hypothetical protein
MNKRKLRMTYRRYLFSYSFEIIGRPEIPLYQVPAQARAKQSALCRL